MDWCPAQRESYDFHPISTTETRNKTTTLIGRRKNENIYANTFNNLDYLFTEHEGCALNPLNREKLSFVTKYYKFVTNTFLSKLKLTVNKSTIKNKA